LRLSRSNHDFLAIKNLALYRQAVVPQALYAAGCC
jgi:hypothetical protein